jgi:probable rRNA maturation factor
MSESVIDISYEQPEFEQTAPRQLVLSRLLSILQELGQDGCEFSVTFATDETIRELNRRYRDKDEPTDILTFVQADGPGELFWPDADGGDEGAARLLGDMVISLDALQRNAQYFTVSTDEELYRLLIHGVLHLLGGDHETNDASEPMLIEQEALLSRLGGTKR